MFAFIKPLAEAEAFRSAIEAASPNSTHVEAIRTLTAKEAEAVSGGHFVEGYAPPSRGGGVDPRFAELAGRRSPTGEPSPAAESLPAPAA